MSNTKEIQKRMKSIKDTMKITNAQYMISSSKLRNAKQRLEATEPYFFSLQNAFSSFLRHVPDTDSIYFDQKKKIPEGQKKRGYIVITADKGMAGAYNHNVIKKAHELFSLGEHNRLFVLGELGRQYFAKEGLKVDTQIRYTVQNPTLHRSRIISDRVMNLYDQDVLDEVYIVYTKMENAFSMNTEVLQLLPLKKEDFSKVSEDLHPDELRVEPSIEAVLEHLVPNYVSGFIYGALVESYASEHNSRMMAMQAATDNAKDLLQTLTIEFNRVRQAAITQEILEVISGAKAQKRKKKK